jgi:DNA-directed RNA polymerase subunit beta'
MRTFHTGGVGTRSVSETEYRGSTAAPSSSATATRSPSRTSDGNDCLVSLKRNGEIVILDDKGRELEKIQGALRRVHLRDQARREGQARQSSSVGPAPTPILAEKARHRPLRGHHRRRDRPRGGRRARARRPLVVIEHKGETCTRRSSSRSDGNILDFHYLPAKARLEVEGRPGDQGRPHARPSAQGRRRLGRTSSAVCPA